MHDDNATGDDRRVPVPVFGPRPLGGLADLAELLGGESRRSRRFLGGIAIGALVGAALAGGSFLRRRGRESDVSRRGPGRPG